RAGVMNDIPQLTGDGGAGLVFAGICALTGLWACWQPGWAVAGFVTAGLLAVGTAWDFGDPVVYAWAAAAGLVGAASWLAARSLRPRGRHVRQRQPARHARRSVGRA
ncbi:MAG: hypothetical protein K6T31_08360, partial [Alicyclobacillus sp.]|nr:hypothetical protein [Alicyclobacillus sp.]